MPKTDNLEGKVLVTNTVIATAYDNFCTKYHPNSSGMGLYFWNFIGMKEGPSIFATRDGWYLPSDVARRAEQLAGLHWKAVAKK